MKRVAAGAHLPTPWLLSLRNAQTLKPTTARTAVSSSSARARYSFLQLSRLGRALWANSGEGSAQSMSILEEDLQEKFGNHGFKRNGLLVITGHCGSCSESVSDVMNHKPVMDQTNPMSALYIVVLCRYQLKLITSLHSFTVPQTPTSSSFGRVRL